MKRPLSFLVIVFLFSGTESCAVAPSEDDLRGAVTDYFEGQHYGVVNIRIGKIEGVPLAEKTYMGTPGYVVEVPAITLEAKQDKGLNIRKGDRLIFSNARIRVRQDPGNRGRWHVSIISGIAVP